MQNISTSARRGAARLALVSALALGGFGLLGFGLLGWAAPAHAQVRFQVTGTTLRAIGPSGAQSIELGCAGTQALALGRTVYVACGAEGVVRVEVPESGLPTVQRVPIRGEVQGLFAANGAIWARLPGGTAQQLQGPIPAAPAAPAGAETPQAGPAGELAAPAGEGGPEVAPVPPAGAVVPPVAALPQAGQPPPLGAYPQPGFVPPPIGGRIVGEVVEQREGYAIVELRPELTLNEGAAVELVRPADQGPLALGGESEELVVAARGEVVAVSGDRARVRVEMNGRVREGMSVRDTGRGSGLSLMPPLPTDSFELSFMVRAYLPIDTLGFGALNDVQASYLTEPGIRLGVDISPLGFGVSNNGNPFGSTMHATVGYAMRWFEVGLGFGWSSIATRFSGVCAFDPDPPPSCTDLQGGFSLQQRIRFGNEDGLSFHARTNVLVRDEAWSFGDLYMDLRIPVAHGAWILVGGGGGTTGVRYGEGGARVLLSGNGGGASLFLKVTVGVGMIESGSFAYAGPMLGAGLDWRI